MMVQILYASQKVTLFQAIIRTLVHTDYNPTTCLHFVDNINI